MVAAGSIDTEAGGKEIPGAVAEQGSAIGTFAGAYWKSSAVDQLPVPPGLVRTTK